MRRRIKEGVHVNNFSGNYIAIVAGKRWGASRRLTISYQPSAGILAEGGRVQLFPYWLAKTSQAIW